MRTITGVLIIVMLCLFLSGASGDGVQHNRALLIGVDTFISKENTASTAENDVQIMADTLRFGTIPFETILIPDQPVSSAQILEHVIREAFQEADDSDNSYLYISTHGAYNDDGEAVLLLSDGQTEVGVTAMELQAMLDGIRGRKVLVLDACYSGAFIGKGCRVQPDKVAFRTPDYKVLTSSGAAEESWYWNGQGNAGQGNAAQGSFYFTQVLAQGLSPRWNYPADLNKNGAVTLAELHHYLLQNHGASTPQLYPQEDDTVIFTYNPAAKIAEDRAPIVDVVFSDDVMLADDTVTLTFTAVRPVRVAYQIVYFREGKWQFDEAELLYDNAERFTAFGDLAGAVMPGRKVREITLAPNGNDLYGYVLVQVLSLEEDVLTLQTGHVITVTPRTGNLLLSVQTPDVFRAAVGTELPIFVQHSLPCALSVTVVDKEGHTVKRLSFRSSTRPLGIWPAGSCYYWNGRDAGGSLVPAGEYRVRVEAWMGDSSFAANSQIIEITR